MQGAFLRKLAHVEPAIADDHQTLQASSISECEMPFRASFGRRRGQKDRCQKEDRRLELTPHVSRVF